MGRFLLAMVSPLVSRILLSLGMSVVSFTGISLIYSQIKGLIESGLAGVPAAALQLAALAGVPEGFALILGALSFSVAFWSASSAKRLVFN